MGTVSNLKYVNLPKVDVESESRSTVAIKLRCHPLMSYRGVSNWPPVWTWIDGEEIKHAEGEVGILKEVKLSNVRPADRILMLIEHEKDRYIGCVPFDNYFFCRMILPLLEQYRSHSLQEIGELELFYVE